MQVGMDQSKLVGLLRTLKQGPYLLNNSFNEIAILQRADRGRIVRPGCDVLIEIIVMFLAQAI